VPLEREIESERERESKRAREPERERKRERDRERAREILNFDKFIEIQKSSHYRATTRLADAS
jgi:hypothetical protein